MWLLGAKFLESRVRPHEGDTFVDFRTNSYTVGTKSMSKNQCVIFNGSINIQDPMTPSLSSKPVESVAAPIDCPNIVSADPIATLSLNSTPYSMFRSHQGVNSRASYLPSMDSPPPYVTD